MRRRGGRAGLAMVVIVLSALGLSGCDQWLPDPIALTVVGDVPVMRFCLPVTISEISVRTYQDEADHDGELVWSATGHTDLEEGAEIRLGAAPADWAVSGDPPPDLLTQTVLVDVAATDSYGEHQFTAFIEPDAWEEGRWIDGTGASTEPCVRPSCDAGWACQNAWPQPTGPALRPDPTLTP